MNDLFSQKMASVSPVVKSKGVFTKEYYTPISVLCIFEIPLNSIISLL